MSLPLPPRAVRRVFVDPLWIPIAVCLEVLLAVTIVVAYVVRPLTPRARVLRLAVFAATYIALDVGLMMAALGLWLRHPSRRRDREAWLAAHCRLLVGALIRLDRVAGRALGYRVDLETPTVVPSGEGPLIVLARRVPAPIDRAARSATVAIRSARTGTAISAAPVGVGARRSET